MIHKNNFQTNGCKSKQRAMGLLAILCSAFMFVAVACAFGTFCFGTQTQQTQVLNANAAGDNYLTFTANTAGSTVTFKCNGGTWQYSTDGSTWSATYDQNSSAQTITLTNVGDYVKFKGTNVTTGWDSEDEYYLYIFEMTGSISASGDVTSLTNGVGGDATLTETCYDSMFNGCTSLTTAPNLPATSLTENCYYCMFGGCTSLTTAPALPATTLASDCYSGMFSGCTSLTTAPALPATTLQSGCYSYMFNGCTSLTTAPELPATTLCNSCYSKMFKGCTSLKTAPELPATVLTKDGEKIPGGCYSYMFEGCTSLTTAPELPATTLTPSCYSYMFNGCTSLTTAPELPATTLARYCYTRMFKGCTGLVIKASKDSTCTEEWKIAATTDYQPTEYWEPEDGSEYETMFEDCTGVDFGSGSTEPALNTTYYQKASEQPPVPSTGVYFDNTMAVVSSGIILASLVALFVLLAKRKKNN